jgi:hypothetical protein
MLVEKAFDFVRLTVRTYVAGEQIDKFLETEEENLESETGKGCVKF